jgi:hypothetical protein
MLLREMMEPEPTPENGHKEESCETNEVEGYPTMN